MIVFIAGMPRSGSTFSFNVVRELLEKDGIVYCEASCDIATVLSRARNASHVIIKAHADGELLRQLVKHDAIRTICTVRPLEDAVASLIEVFVISVEEAIGTIRQWCLMYRNIVSSCLTVNYDMIETNPDVAADAMGSFVRHGAPDARTIGLKYSRSRVADMVPVNPDGPGIRDVGFSYYDERTFFHRRHISSLARRSAHDRLSADDLVRIRSELKEEIAFLRTEAGRRI